MRRLALAFLLAATPVHAEPDARQLPIQTARDNGCLLTDAVAKAALLSLGVTEADLLATFQAMRSAGEADATIGAMRLAPPLCEGVTHARLPSVTPQMACEIAVFRANCCRLEADAAMPALAKSGNGEDDLIRTGPESIALGDLGLVLWDKVTGTVTVTEPLCSAPVVAPDPTEPLIRLLRENGCVLSRGDVAKFADYGLTFEMATRMSAYLIELGTVRVAHGPTLVLDNCPE